MRYEESTKEQLIAQCIEMAKSLRELKLEFSILVNNIPALVFKGYADWSVEFRTDNIEEITGYAKADFDSGRLICRRCSWSGQIS